jgi:hypothetical protein
LDKRANDPNCHVSEVTRRWREAAARAKIARADVELTAIAFEQSGAALSETCDNLGCNGGMPAQRNRAGPPFGIATKARTFFANMPLSRWRCLDVANFTRGEGGVFLHTPGG